MRHWMAFTLLLAACGDTAPGPDEDDPRCTVASGDIAPIFRLVNETGASNFSGEVMVWLEPFTESRTPAFVYERDGEDPQAYESAVRAPSGTLAKVTTSVYVAHPGADPETFSDSRDIVIDRTCDLRVTVGPGRSIAYAWRMP